MVRYAESRLYSFGRQSQAEDVVQNAYLSLWEHRATVVNIFGYMTSIIRKEALHLTCSRDIPIYDVGLKDKSISPLEYLLCDEQWSLIEKWGEQFTRSEAATWKTFIATDFDPTDTHAGSISVNKIKDSMRMSANELGWKFGTRGK